MDGARVSNWVLFAAAAMFAAALAVWFTFDFFRDEPEANSVSVEIVLLGLGFIGAYAGSNRIYKVQCGRNGNGMPRAKPGELIFAGLVVWAVAMITLYQTKALWHWKEITLDVPEHFVLFMGAILTIFTGTRLWDIISPTRRTGNIPKEDNKSKARAS